jgi:adenine-specific DNA methylase
MTVSVEQENQRQFGIYYTPTQLTESICGWAVRDADNRVLEPSFGGCVFLKSAARALRARGATKPFLQLYGCDIDANAFKHLRRLFPNRKYAKRFYCGDFFATDPISTGFPLFDAIVGNPPYVSNHTMTESQREAARKATKKGVLSVPATASLWAHFLNHSLRFLKEGGRLAMVLPGSAFRATYGRVVFSQLTKQFGSVHTISLTERVFVDRGAREGTTILLCDDWLARDKAQNSPRESRVQTLNELESLLPRANGHDRLHEIGEKRVRLNLCDLTRPIAKGIRAGSFVELRTVADVQIGVVTGANHFFVMTKKQAEKLRIPPEALNSMLARMKMAPGALLTQVDLSEAKARGECCLLLDTRGFERRTSIVEYLSTFGKRARKRNKTFGKRSIWHQPVRGRVPDAFLSYMNKHRPRIVINGARAQSLNNIHRLYLKPKGSIKSLKLATITLCSTIGQLASELVGRSYGEGVLKLEPSEARQLPIVASRLVATRAVNACFKRVDTLGRKNQWKKAQTVADNLMLHALPNLLNIDVLREMTVYLNSLRAHRGLP